MPPASRIVLSYGIALAGGVLVPAARAVAQGEASASGTVRVTVVDTLGKAIVDADVTLADSANTTILRAVRVPASGTVTLSDIPGGTKYVLLARKIGYAVAESAPLLVKAGDTLKLQFELTPLQALSTVEVTGRATGRAYRADDRELGRRPIDNMRLWEVIGRYWWWMLGDEYKCPCMPIETIYVNGIRWYPFGANSMDYMHRDSMRRDFDAMRDSILKLRGIKTGQCNQVGIGNFQFTGIHELLSRKLGFPITGRRPDSFKRRRQSGFDPLAQIFASDVKEIRYINCWDEELPHLRNSLVIVLKPGVEFPAEKWGEPMHSPTRGRPSNKHSVLAYGGQRSAAAFPAMFAWRYRSFSSGEDERSIDRGVCR